jgi:transcriptional regulator with XRE-family HTH domain
MKLPRKTLGGLVRDARVAKGLTLRALASQVQCAPSYLNDIEYNRRVPSEEVLRRIASELDLDIDLLLAMAGRVGAGAEEFMKSNPTAGVLFRRVSEAGLKESDLKKLLESAEKMAREQAPEESE